MKNVKITVNNRERKIPTESDWGDYKCDMDVMDAFNTFFGKSNKEAQRTFLNNVTTRTSELRFMPEIPFQYYMIGFKDFVDSNLYKKIDAPDVANCFIGLIEEKLNTMPDYIVPIMNELISTLDEIAMQQDSLGAPEYIYGNFQEKANSIKKLYSKICEE